MEQPVRYLQQEVGSRAQPCISWHTFSGLLHLLNSDTKEKNWSSQFLSSSRLTVKPLVAKDIWKMRLLTEMVPERLMGSSRPVGSSKTWFYCFQGLSVWGPQLQLFFFFIFLHENVSQKSWKKISSTFCALPTVLSELKSRRTGNRTRSSLQTECRSLVSDWKRCVSESSYLEQFANSHLKQNLFG